MGLWFLALASVLVVGVLTVGGQFRKQALGSITYVCKQWTQVTE